MSSLVETPKSHNPNPHLHKWRQGPGEIVFLRPDGWDEGVGLLSPAQDCFTLRVTCASFRARNINETREKDEEIVALS